VRGTKSSRPKRERPITSSRSTKAYQKKGRKKNKQNREPYHIKHREKRLGREKSREGLCESVGSLSSPDLSFLLLPNCSWFLSLLWCLTSERPVTSGGRDQRYTPALQY